VDEPPQLRQILASAVPLVGERGVTEPVADHDPASRQGRPDHALDVLGAGGVEEQRVASGGVLDLAAQEERPDALAERGSARLAGQQDVVAAALERRGQTPGLAALACAVRTLEGDESTSDPRLLHGAKSTPGQPSGGQPSAPCWVVRKAGAKVPFRGSRDQATIWRVPSPKMILDEGDRATLRRILAAAIAEAEANENQPAATLYDGGMVCGGRGYQSGKLNPSGGATVIPTWIVGGLMALRAAPFLAWRVSRRLIKARRGGGRWREPRHQS